MRTIAIAGRKKGSGKTTTARCLCAVLAKEYRQRVLLVDVDPHADLSTRCDVEGEGASLAEVLSGSVPVSDVLVKIARASKCYPSLWCMLSYPSFVSRRWSRLQWKMSLNACWRPWLMSLISPCWICPPLAWPVDRERSGGGAGSVNPCPA